MEIARKSSDRLHSWYSIAFGKIGVICHHEYTFRETTLGRGQFHGGVKRNFLLSMNSFFFYTFLDFWHQNDFDTP